MKAEQEDDIEHHAHDDGDDIGAQARLMLGPLATDFRHHDIGQRDDEERAEQPHIGALAVGEQMARCPQPHADRHRVVQPLLQVALAVRGTEHDEAQQHQRHGHVLRPWCRHIDPVSGKGA